MVNDGAVIDRIAAIQTLARIGPEAEEAVPELIKALAHKDRRVSYSAGDALGRIGPAAGNAADVLIGILREKGTLDEVGGVKALVGIGDGVVPHLGRAVRDEKNAALREQAAVILGDMGPKAARAVPDLIQSLSMKNGQAAIALAKIGEPAVPAVGKALDEALRTKAETRVPLASALRSIGPGAADAAPVLMAALKDDDGVVRLFAAETLRKIDASDKMARVLVPVYIDLSKGPKRGFRTESIRALGAIGPEAKDAMKTLRDALQDADPVIRSEAAETLGWIGQADAAVIDDLTAALKDPRVRRAAAFSLGRLGPASAPAIPALLDAARADLSCGEALRQIGAKSVPAIRDALLKDKDTARVRERLVEILAGFGPAAADAAPALILILKNGDPEVREDAVVALAAIGPQAKPALPTLARSLNAAWVKAMAKIDAPASLPYWTEALLEHRDPAVRLAIAQSLGEMGAAANKAMPTLARVVREDASPYVRAAAAEAIKKIDPKSK